MGIGAAVGLGVAGIALQGYGLSLQGKAAKSAAQGRQIAGEWEAKQLEQDAGQSIAASQRAALKIGETTTLINSQALARAAASGAGASDPGVIGIVAKTAGEGSYHQSLALYEGESQARMDRLKAASARLEGKLGVSAGNQINQYAQINAVGTVLAQGAGMYGMYSKYYSGTGAGAGLPSGANYSGSM